MMHPPRSESDAPDAGRLRREVEAPRSAPGLWAPLMALSAAAMLTIVTGVAVMNRTPRRMPATATPMTPPPVIDDVVSTEELQAANDALVAMRAEAALARCAGPVYHADPDHPESYEGCAALRAAPPPPAPPVEPGVTQHELDLVVTTELASLRSCMRSWGHRAHRSRADVTLALEVWTDGTARLRDATGIDEVASACLFSAVARHRFAAGDHVTTAELLVMYRDGDLLADVRRLGAMHFAAIGPM